MVRNILNKAGEPSKVGVIKRAAGRPKKVVEPVGEITSKEVIKPLNMKKLPTSKTVAVKKAVKKETKPKTEKAVVKAKKAVSVAVKNVSTKKEATKSGMERKLASIKKAKKTARPEVNVDMEIRSSQDLETELAPAASREETMALFANSKKAKGVFVVEKTGEETKIMMWTGVVFFMILIGAIWAYNIKAVLDVTSGSAKKGNVMASENVDNLKKNIQDIRQDLDKVRSEEVSRDDLFRPATENGQAAPVGGTNEVVPAANASSSEVK